MFKGEDYKGSPSNPIIIFEEEPYVQVYTGPKISYQIQDKIIVFFGWRLNPNPERDYLLFLVQKDKETSTVWDYSYKNENTYAVGRHLLNAYFNKDDVEKHLSMIIYDKFHLTTSEKKLSPHFQNENDFCSRLLLIDNRFLTILSEEFKEEERNQNLLSSLNEVPLVPFF